MIYLAQFVEACMYYTFTICFNTKSQSEIHESVISCDKKKSLMYVGRGPPENCWGSPARGPWCNAPVALAVATALPTL